MPVEVRLGLVDHFNFKNEIYTLARRANGDCRFLDAVTRRCTVYEKRPESVGSIRRWGRGRDFARMGCGLGSKSA